MSCDEIAQGETDAAVGVQQSTWPASIVLNQAGGTLDLVWDNMDVSVSHKVLRAACRCTECESMRRKTGATVPVAPDIELTRIEPIGTVGLQFFFSDGHQRGIYPWPYLHEIAYRHGPNADVLC